MHHGAGKCLLRSKMFRYSVPMQTLHSLNPQENSRKYKIQNIKKEMRRDINPKFWSSFAWNNIAYPPAFPTQFTSIFSFWLFSCSLSSVFYSFKHLPVTLDSFLLQASDFLVMKWQFAVTRQLCLDRVFVWERKEHRLCRLQSAMHKSDLVSC